MPYKKYITTEDILAKVNIVDGCWVWPTTSKSGYASIYMGGGRSNQIIKNAHRVSYEIAKGSIPNKKVLDHLCRNPPCVNPDHLEVVSQKTNILRGVGLAAKNADATKCVNGHDFNKAVSNYYSSRGWKRCLTCHADNQRARRTKLKGVYA